MYYRARLTAAQRVWVISSAHVLSDLGRHQRSSSSGRFIDQVGVAVRGLRAGVARSGLL